MNNTPGTKALYILMMLAAGLTSGARAQDAIAGKVMRVIDGNTVEVTDEGQQVWKVVLAGVDCPEIGQAYGEEARSYTEKKLMKKKVTLQLQGKDRWGNYLGIILVDDDDYRVALLKEGLAWTSEKNPSPELEPYRTWAQKKAKGLWQQENPTPPWVYRRQQTMAQPKSS